MGTEPRIKFSEELLRVLGALEADNNYIAFEMSYMAEPASYYFNGLNITHIDVGKDWTFKVTIHGKEHMMKIGKFLRFYFKGYFDSPEITSFGYAYNKLKNDPKASKSQEVEIEEFVYKPKDPRSTFISLVTKTYPYGHEAEVLKFLPPGLEKDKHDNYFQIIGDNKKPSTCFASHLDTVDRKQSDVVLMTREEEGDEIIYTDGSTILGADDKSGTTIMLYMMAHNIPGLYYFFIGEERGTIGSGAVCGDIGNLDYMENVKKIISFDRRKTTSVITKQHGRTCCSDVFCEALCKEYRKGGVFYKADPTGVFTDSAAFIDDIPEGTNLSVGYLKEHTTKESQNMTFLIKMCEASILVDWEKLPVARKTGINTEILKKHKSFIDEIKKTNFNIEVKIVGFEDDIFVRIDTDFGDIKTIYTTLSRIKGLLKKHKMRDHITISRSYIKIEMK